AYLLIDGWHRIEAAERCGYREIACVIWEGTWESARLLAASRNVGHGRRRSVADKRRALWLILTHPDAQDWSLAQVSRHCCVTVPLAQRVRVELEAVRCKVDCGELDEAGARQALSRVAAECPLDVGPDDPAVLRGRAMRTVRHLDRLAELMGTDAYSLL